MCPGDAARSSRPRRRWLRAACLAVTALCAVLSLGAGKEWPGSYESGPFQCRAEFSLVESAAFLESLGELRQDIAAALEVELVDEPVEVLLFRNRWNFRRYVGQRVPEGAGRPALFVKGDGTPGRVYATAGRDMELNLRHECTHATLHACLSIVPVWLDEGLAKYFEMPPSERAGGHGFLRQVKLNTYVGWRPGLENLEGKRDMQDMSLGDYRDAWATVHFMLHGPPEAHRALVAYLSDIQEGNPPGKLSQRLAAAVPDVERRVAEHFRGWR